jgi:hypothetical protein
VPAEQPTHEVAPVFAWNVPGLQLAHDDWPVVEAKVPASQSGHVLAPLTGP